MVPLFNAGEQPASLSFRPFHHLTITYTFCVTPVEYHPLLSLQTLETPLRFATTYMLIKYFHLPVSVSRFGPRNNAPCCTVLWQQFFILGSQSHTGL